RPELSRKKSGNCNRAKRKRSRMCSAKKVSRAVCRRRTWNIYSRKIDSLRKRIFFRREAGRVSPLRAVLFQASGAPRTGAPYPPRTFEMGLEFRKLPFVLKPDSLERFAPTGKRLHQSRRRRGGQEGFRPWHPEKC